MTSPSLFAPDAQPVTTGALELVETALLGSLGVGLCVLAVAFVGCRMLLGFLPVAMATRVVVGAVILLSAPIVASTFVGTSESVTISAPIEDRSAYQTERNQLAPTADPNAGASLRRD